ncbi:MAG: universal stress protein [Desulfitobacteriaceae bacterium]|nr:universal stress protein [Desulfitobacteriaceae bacterium]MDI6878309.1 universal stress protein [Desulfitobacteriaceae bacterium]MDI6914581.1 universal stress protein [Desulfitobacteriaceae bacterium]
MDIRRILVGLDGSESSKKAFRAAVELGRKLSASVTTLTVVHLPDFSPGGGEVAELDQAQAYYEPVLQKTRSYASSLGSDIQTVILSGHPTEQLLEYAEQNKMDLIVIGTRGLGGFKRLLMGSVAQKVVSYSTIPVLVIRE